MEVRSCCSLTSTETEKTEGQVSRRNFLHGTGALTAAGLLAAGSTNIAHAASPPGCSVWQKPTDADFHEVTRGRDKPEVIDHILAVLENEVVPKTMRGVKAGNKLFGAAVLDKHDLSTVIAETNAETGNPLMHGEVTAIFAFYDLPKDKRPAPQDTLFIATHEPCPLCLSSITWGGFDNFFYLFTYEDSRDAYGIPHDIVMLDEIFRDPEGSYSEKNKFWSSWGIRDLIATLPADEQPPFTKRVEALRVTYAEMSDIYQKAKAAGKGADVPLK